MSAAILVAVLCALAFFNGAEAEAEWIGSGECPQTVKPLENFDLAKFTGVWFELNRGGVLYEFDGTCIQSKYTLNQEGRVDVKIALKEKYGDKLVTIAGKAHLPDKSATLNVTLPKGDSHSNLSWSVLETDYENYAAVYSCSSNGGAYREEAWMLSRETGLSIEHRDKVEKALSTNGLRTMTGTEQNCGTIV